MTHTDSHIEEPTTLEVSGWSIPAALTLPASRIPDETLPSAILLVPGSLFSDVNGDRPCRRTSSDRKRLAIRGRSMRASSTESMLGFAQ